jgi:tetratricopeptide (TPR) repeat protein
MQKMAVGQHIWCRGLKIKKLKESFMFRVKKFFIVVLILSGVLFSSCSLFSKEDVTDVNDYSSMEQVQQQANTEFAKKLYKQAKGFASEDEYIRATELLLTILKVAPRYEAAKTLNAKISKKMYLTSRKEMDLQISESSYAKGYVSYFSKNYDSAIAQWTRYLQFSKYNEEVQEYLYKIDLMRMFELGQNSFSNKQYIDCIKQMGKLQDFIMTKPAFADSLIYYDKAKTYIDNCISVLRSNVSRLNASDDSVVTQASSKQTAVVESAQNNIAEANKKYEEGLMYYSQGDYIRANRTWELALRLNPNLDRAKVAISNLRRNRVVED